jgi:putative RNA 2'-phosphotransferase
MDSRALTRLSKFLSFVLRHDPGAVGVELDRNGWVDIDHLLAQCRAHGKPLSREVLDAVVAAGPRRRFAISEDGRRVRASQGHSVEVDLGYQPAAPPELLYHGTVAASLADIRGSGLARMARHHVHLSPDEATARAVGGRRGHPVVLRIAAGRMHRDGHRFLLSANGVPGGSGPSASASASAGVAWSVAVEATGWELMLQFARYGVGIAVVNDFCPPPRGMVARPLAGAPAIPYHLIGRAGFTSKGADAMRALILETVPSA